MKYQKIKFGDKTYLDGTDRMEEYNLMFPNPPINKIILDIGCNVGYYCMKASQEGAEYCIGIDNFEKGINTGKEIVKDISLNTVNLIHQNIFDFTSALLFDIVLCINFLHNINTIQNVRDLLRRINEWCKEKTFITIIPSNRDWEYFRNSNGHQKIKLSENFIKNYFPKSTFEVHDSKVTEGRKIVEIRKWTT